MIQVVSGGFRRVPASLRGISGGTRTFRGVTFQGLKRFPGTVQGVSGAFMEF